MTSPARAAGTLAVIGACDIFDDTFVIWPFCPAAGSIAANQLKLSKLPQFPQTGHHCDCVAPQWLQRHSASRGARAARDSQA